MGTLAPAGLPERFGRRLGSLVLFFIYDKNVIFRWIKRILLAGLLFYGLLGLGIEFAKTLTTLAVFTFFGLALAMSSGASASEPDHHTDLSGHLNIPREGPAGYGYYDGHGNFRGSTDPGDAD